VDFSKMSKYHDGERQLQKLMGVRAEAERLSGSVRHSIPAAAQSFLEEQEFAAITWRDKNGRLWTTPLTGAPGFLFALNDDTVVCDLSRATAPVLMEQLFEDAPVGLVVMDFYRSRRMRVNGFATATVAALGKRSWLVIKTAEVYANCPKFIQRREPVDELVVDSVITSGAAPTVEIANALSLAHQRLINSADTFFIGTFADGNADASHRGGNPGFVRADDQRIYWLDYPGNNMFNTLGNIQSNRESALLFVDFLTRDCLAVSGQIVTFDASRKGEIANSETVFQVNSAMFITSALAAKWRFIESSPFNPTQLDLVDAGK